MLFITSPQGNPSSPGVRPRLMLVFEPIGDGRRVVDLGRGACFLADKCALKLIEVRPALPTAEIGQGGAAC